MHIGKINERSRNVKTVFYRMERAREKMEGICTSTLTMQEIRDTCTVGGW